MGGAIRSAQKFSIRFTVGAMFMFATVLTATFAIGLQYYFSKQLSQEHVLSKLTMATAEISEYISQIDANATSSARILRGVAAATSDSLSDAEIRDILIQVLSDNPLFYSIYYGRDDDRFYQIINLDSSPVVREKMQAVQGERWVINQVYGNKNQRIKVAHYLTDDLAVTRTIETSSNYFPTQRPWYQGAGDERVFKTDPYLFQHLKITGQTYSVRTQNAVLGIDIVLSAVNAMIDADEMGLASNAESNTESYVFSENGQVIASNPSHDKTLDSSSFSASTLVLNEEQRAFATFTRPLLVSNQNDWSPYDFAQAGEPQGYVIELLKQVSEMTGLTFEFFNGFSREELLTKFQNNNLDILHPLTADAAVNGIQSVPLFYEVIAIIGHQDRSMPKRLSELRELSVGVINNNGLAETLFRLAPEVELTPLGSMEEAKKWLLADNNRYLIDTQSVLNHMLGAIQVSSYRVHAFDELEAIPYYLYLHHQDAEVAELIDLALSKMTPEHQSALKDKWLDSARWHGRFVPYSQLLELVARKEMHNVMVKTTINDESKYVFITPLLNRNGNKEYFAVIIDEQLVTQQATERLWASVGGTIVVMMIIVPIAWLFGAPIVTPITQLRAETRKIKARQFDHVALVDTRIKEVHELSLSMVEMAQEIQKHEKQQEEFVEAFIRLIAQAIDDKSPYTAGHCNRVPELGLMLAKAVEEADEGPLSTFRFNNDGERREFRIAAWLHDCGKITTPDHIVDKGTKLEANYNRINEIRTRFEVLWRDAEIEYLHALLRKDEEQYARNLLMQKQRQLRDDFAFVAAANVGGEFMSQDNIERIKQIGSQTWQRNFDDKLGLSPFEELARPEPSLPLPTTETLLADKSEHIIKRIRPISFDPALGINVEVPEYQYNLGEIYNLSISRGTLTAEDRFKINEHMTSGIKMLESLPFPDELRRVPRYASTHHETLKGTGYPRKLSAIDLSVPERILAIADIFEALTAADRPYKKAKPISVAIDIMYNMALDEHIDMDIFKLFLERGIYADYAHEFLPQQQIDDVDIGQYVKAEFVSPNEAA